MARARKTTHSRKTAARKSTRRAAPKRWSQRVTKESDALDLKQGVFKLTSAKKIATSLKRSAEHSARRKTGAYRSALSMLTFYINRAGKTLPQTQRTRLERAKVELKRAFGREGVPRRPGQAQRRSRTYYPTEQFGDDSELAVRPITAAWANGSWLSPGRH
jgi:hypothetical protein